MLRSTWLPVLLACLPMLAGAATLAGHSGDYSPFGDGAFTVVHVRDVGHTSVQLGPFSRYGWSHPGPALYYVLAPFYWLSGHAAVSLAVASLLINCACVAGIAALVRRRAGAAAMLGTLVIVAIYLQLLGPSVLRDDWNPHLPVLPFTLSVFVAWSLTEGRAWALPALVALDSLVVQAHVGFLTPVAAVAVGTAAILIGRAVLARRRTRSRPAEVEAEAEVEPEPAAPPRSRAGRRSWFVAGIVAVIVLAVIWLPPLLQQINGRTGNLSAIVDWFTSTKPNGTYRQGVQWVGADIGALPGYLVGARPAGTGVPRLAGWTAVLALIALAAGAAVAYRRKVMAFVPLLVFVAATVLAVVFSVQRIVGPPFDYLVRWGFAAGILLWTAVAVALLAGRRVGNLGVSLALIILVALAVPGARGNIRATTPWTSTDGTVPALTKAALSWLGPHRSDLVRVDIGPATGADFFSLSNPTGALALSLIEAGVPVRMQEFWRGAMGNRYIDGVQRARRQIVVARADGPPPSVGQRVVGRAGDYLLYGGELRPTG